MFDGGGHDCCVTTAEGAELDVVSAGVLAVVGELVLVVVVVAWCTWADADLDSAGS
jgi:hypothetical protein